MHILRRWSMRMVHEDRTRTVMVIVAVIAIFTIWVSADFLVISTIESTGINEENTFGINIPSLISCIKEPGVGFWGGVWKWIGLLSREPFSGNLLTNTLFRALNNYLYGGLFIGMCVVMYGIFSVTADECLQEYRILTSSGVTARQVRRSLQQQAIGLSLIGAVAGVSTGILTARFSTDPATFHTVLTDHFFQDKRTQLMLAAGMLAPPCIMQLAVRFAFRNRRQNKPVRAPRRGTFHRYMFAQQLFGVGGRLGCLTNRKNIRYRVIFTASIAICLAMLAQLYNLLTVFNEMNTLDPALTIETDLEIDDTVKDNTDLYIECDAGSRADVLNTVLRQNADRIGIESCATLFEPTAWNDCSFVLFDCAWMNPWYVDHNPDQIVVRDGKSALLWKSPGYLFMDDASFDRIIQKNGIDPGSEGALFCNFRYYSDQKRVAPLEKLPDQDITLYFLPQSIEENDTDRSAESLLRAADPAAEKKTIRILGRIEPVPYAWDLDRPTLIFPERAFASFVQSLSSSKAASFDIKKGYYFDLSDPEKGIPMFKAAIESDPRLDVTDENWKLFGLDEQETSAQERRPITVYDMQDMHYRLETFQKMLPHFLRIVMVMVALGLSVGILNTAHMNRMTRRRAKAILESVGMDRQQQAGMLLYEGARYALNSITLGWLLFTVIFFPIWGDYLDLLHDNQFLSQGQSITLRTLILFGTKEDWTPYLHAYRNAFNRTWWIFIGGAVLIFVMLVAAELAISRRSRQEELIKILKDDSTMEF